MSGIRHDGQASTQVTAEYFRKLINQIKQEIYKEIVE